MWTLAIESLSWIELKRLNEDAALSRSVKQLRIYNKDTVNEAKVLIYETVRRKNAIDFLIDESLKPDKLNDLDVGLRSFLRLYTYLVHYSDRPLSVAFDLVDHSRKILGKNVFRKVENIPDIIPSAFLPFEEMTDIQKLSYQHFHPYWYVEKLADEFGYSFAEKLVEYAEYPDYFRLNCLRGSERSLDNLYKQGFQIEADPLMDSTYRILDGEGITETEEYRNGQIIIQDRASILVGEVAQAIPGITVLDVCAAPGIKTSHIAQRMNNSGAIVSVDYDQRRIQQLSRVLDTLGVTIVEPVKADASKIGSLPKVEADLVLVDPPCTSTGLFNKTPSTKWRLTPHSIDKMADLQKKILWNSSRRLKDGGTLVYSTCSITIEENEHVIKNLLDRDTNFKLVESRPFIGDPGFMGYDKAQRLYPHKHDCNGFFIAKLIKYRDMQGSSAYDN